MLPKPLLRISEVEKMRSLYEILAYSAENYGNKIAYRESESKADEHVISFRELREQVDNLASSIENVGLSNPHIVLLGETSIEWILTYLAITSGVGVCVPIDYELRDETILAQINLVEAEVIFCSLKIWKKINPLLPQCKKLKKVVLMRANTSGENEQFTVPVETFSSFVSTSKAKRRLKIDPDAICSIIFTSGTTGANKGVMLSNRNILGTLRGCARLLHYPETSISVLPINHTFELHAHLMSCLYCGTTVFLNDDIKHLMKNLKKARPEMTCMVPMMLDMIQRKLLIEIRKQGKEKAFNRAKKFRGLLSDEWRRKKFHALLEPLGGELRMVICGGAYLSQATIDFFNTIGVKVYNGYGISECSPVAAVNPYHHRKKESVGRLLPTMEAKILDPDENGNGEILLKGDNVMKGYYEDIESTKAVIDSDGWLHTGDIGYLDADEYLYISGRVKNLIILPNGKNVCPEEIEEQLKKHVPGIKECIVMGNKSNSGLYAIIYPDADFFKGKEADGYFQQQMKDFNQGAASFKRISDFKIAEKEFEKNSTHKILRYKYMVGGLEKNV